MKLPLERAASMLSKRKFNECLKALEDAPDLYRENFSYYITGGIACLYLDDFGTANRYFQFARRYNVTDPQLLLGQAALYLRVGDVARALQYYMDILEAEPKNRTAKRGIAFIKEKATPEEIYRLVESGGLRKFYPPLGPNPSAVFAVLLGVVLVFAAVCFLSILKPALEKLRPTEIRFSDSTEFLSADDYSVSLDSLKSGNFEGTPGDDLPSTQEEIEKCYRSAYEFATEGSKDDSTVRRVNMARYEVNRLLLSPAVSEQVKTKARGIAAALDADKSSEPVFSTLLDNFPCEKVVSNPLLYNGCYVRWLGRLWNSREEDGIFKCSFFVSDEQQSRILGIFDMVFPTVPSEPISGDKILEVLARISVENDADGKIRVVLTEKQYAVHLRNQSSLQEQNIK